MVVMIMPMTFDQFPGLRYCAYGLGGLPDLHRPQWYVLKATVFEQVSDRLFTDLHVVDML